MSSSSTSSSSWAPYRFFLRGLLFAALWAALAQLWRLAGLGYPDIPEPQRPGDTVYLAWDNMNYDHLRYLYTPEPMQSAAQANLLLLGNSRLMLGVDWAQTMAALRGTPASPHWLGFAQGEGHALPEQLVREHGLAPKLAVVNADTSFFRSGMSLYTQAMLKQGAQKSLAQMQSRLRRNAHWRTFQRLVPMPQVNSWDWRLEHRRKPLIYRSLKHGDWLLSAPGEMIRSEQPVAKPAGQPLPADFEEQLANARRFVELLRSRGAEVAFITVPNPDGGESLALRLGEEIGVEVVQTDWDGYATFDHSHLTPEGAARWTRDMMPKLQQTAAWRRAFGAASTP